MFKKIINQLKRFLGIIEYTHKKKQSRLGKDVVIGSLYTLSKRNLIIGSKVLSKEGIGNVKELKPNDWVVISYKSGRVAEHKVSSLYQYYVETHNIHKNAMQIFPLSYANYEYIHPSEIKDTWIEGHITNKNYFQLTDQEKEDRKLYPIFNKTHGGQHILRELEENKINLKLKNQKLIIIKK